MEKARVFFSKFISLMRKPELRILPGQLAFFLVLSLIPLIALIGTIASALSIPVGTIRSVIGNSVPDAVADIIVSVMSAKGLSFNVVAFFVAAFILASNGTNSMIITSNEIYKIKADSFFRRRLKAIMMTLSLVGLFFFLLVVPIWGDTIFAIIKLSASKKVPIDFIYRIFKLLQYPLTILVLYFNIKLMYITAPDEKIESKETTKGAIFTTVGWILASEIYSFYISTFSNYSMFYGSISNVVILLLWVYILSYIFVLGMIINAGSYSEKDTEKDKIKTLE
ncbi:MAG: YihY/virulence factor BrkB family protein [Bacilli bacterium]|nr:YihY/virulence factor BrkB family protein [Bacilli bacterium]